MKLIDSVFIHPVADSYMLIATRHNKDKRDNVVLTLSSSAGYCLSRVIRQEFNKEDLVALLQEEYDVDEEQATKDIEDLIKVLEREGIVE